jgi:hypothetical protein
VVEERPPDVKPGHAPGGRPGADQREKLVNRGRGTRIPGPVRDGYQRRRGTAAQSVECAIDTI